MKTMLILALAASLPLVGRTQTEPASAAVPIKELAPPPPNPADGKALITPRPPLPTGGAETNPAVELGWAFKNRDTNGDEKLSKTEFAENMRPGFAKADADADGSVTLKEFIDYRRLGGVLQFNDLAYADTDNPRQQLDLFLPRSPRTDRPLPVVVFVHGGGWRKGSKIGGRELVKRFVETGEYAAASIGYRLSDEAQWPSQLHDCKAAIRWLKAHSKDYFIDSAKIGVWGTSAGGHLVALLGTTGDVKELEGTLGKHLDQDSRVACVVNYFGPTDFLTLIKQPSSVDRTQGDQYPEALLLGGAVPEREEVAKQASPVSHVSAGDAPFFTAHGTQDQVVPFAQAQELHAALQRAGVPSLLQEITNGGHGFRSTDLDQRVSKFFDLHLRGTGKEPISTPIVFPESQKR